MKVSVIIPVYKAEAYVAEAVASALAQPEVGEVLLIEDGSQGSVCTLGISMRRPVLAGCLARLAWTWPGARRSALYRRTAGHLLPLDRVKARRGAAEVKREA